MAETMARFCVRGARLAGCGLALMLFAWRTAAAAEPLTITYVGGQLRIEARDSTLGYVLTKVAALTGVKIDVPAEANSEQMPFVKLGPGPARGVLASLLSDSNFDYLIQASDTEPGKIQNVLLIPRERKGAGTPGMEAPGRSTSSPYARATVPDSPVPVQPASAPAEASLDPQPPPPQPDQSPRRAAFLPDQSELAKSAPLSPPPILNSQGISQQLQQMYQQRMQMVQQDRQTLPAAAASPGGK